MKNKKILIFLLFSLFFISFSSTSFADELPSEVTAIIEAFENDSSLYKNYFNNYIIYRNTSNNEILVLLYNSTNTKFGINGSLLTRFYSYSDNNLYYQNGPKWYLGLYHFDTENNSLYSFSCTGERLDISQTSGYCASHSLFDNTQILYAGSDIYTYSGSVSGGYNSTLPFEFDNLEIYIEATVVEENNEENNNEGNNNEENQEENLTVNYNDKLDSIQEELEQVNTNIVYVLDFYLLEVALLLSIIIYLFLHFMLERRKI